MKGPRPGATFAHAGPVLSLVLLAALGGAISAFALDPQRATSQYVIRRWGAGTLPSNTIHSLLQTRDRHLWIGTTTGLVRFDGARLTVFDARTTPSFSDGGAYRLVEAKDGSLFVGTSSGSVLRLEAGAFHRLFVAPGTAYVTSLLPRRDGSVWIGMHGQPMHRWKDGKAAELRAGVVILAPLAMLEDPRGDVWIGTRGQGLYVYRDDTLKRVGATDDMIQALRLDRTGALWIGTRHGLLRMRGGAIDRFTRKDGLTHDNITAILEDRDGNVWVGTAEGGLSRLSLGRWTHLTTKEGLSDDDVRCIIEDHEGNLWVGTGDGLDCVSDGRFITYGRHEGLRDPAVQCVTGARDGSVWIGTAGGDVARLKDGVIRHFTLPAGVGREAVIGLDETRDGSLFVALDNARLFRIKGEAVTEETPREVRWNWRLLFAFEDDLGPVFQVRGAGVRFSRIAGRRYTPAYPQARLRYIHASARDASGALWIGDLAGLARLEGDRWKLYTTQEGLPSNRVRSLSVEPAGGLWAATIGGLAFFKDEVIRKVTTAEGLPENYLRLVLDDQAGHLWIGSMGYLMRLEKSQVFDLFAGRVRQVTPVVFDTSDGLRTREGLLSNSPGFRSADGRLWFATAKGVSVVDPTRIRTDDPAPAVTVERVTVDGVSEARPEYAPGRGEVTIAFTALSFRSPGKLRFRYRLHGFGDSWTDADTRRAAYYSSLPPGRYRFEVTASNADGVWNGPVVSRAFTIRPPFTRTPVFYALCLAAAGTVVAVAYRLRLGQMRARFAAIISERTRIARELHDTLAQGLAGVALQIETAASSLDEGPAAARSHMAMAEAMVRASLAEVRRSIWVLRAQTAKGREGLGATLQESLAQLIADSDVASTVAVTGRPRALPIELAHSVLRIAHEVITNAVRHADAKSIAVELRFGDDCVQLRVKDDGRGFDAAEQARRRGDHFGLVGIEERARAVGGELRLTTAPGAGTEVVCRLPYDAPVDPAAAVGDEVEGVGL